MFLKIIAGVFGGFLVASLAGNIGTLVASKETGTIFLLVAWMASIYIAVKSQRAARAWRWLLIISGCLSFIIPLASLVFATQQEGGAAIIGGMVASGVLGFMFFLFGLALLIIGLLIGRNPNIVVIQKNDDKT